MSTLGNGWNFSVDQSRTFTSIKFIDSVVVKFNELFLPMNGPRNTVMPRGQFFTPSLNATPDSPIPLNDLDETNTLDADTIVTSTLPRSHSPAVHMQPPEHVHIPPPQNATPLENVQPAVLRRMSQRHSAPAPRFDADAPNQQSQLEYNQRSLISHDLLYTLNQCRQHAFVSHDLPTQDPDPTTTTFTGDPLT
jgi:hypothetical protein